MQIRFLRPVDNVANHYFAEVDGVEMTIATRPGQDPKDVLRNMFGGNQSYIEKRLQEYPSIQDQLDMIYHDIEAWRTKIAAIKLRHLKD
jgi:hypothetical protein